jgi:type II secretory pathway pseudopilin PulG
MTKEAGFRLFAGLSDRDLKNRIGMNIMKEKNILHNEDGSVLIISLVVLSLLLIIGVSATNTSNIENLVTRNVENYTEAFYLAEAAAMENAQRLENEAVANLNNPVSIQWLTKSDSVPSFDPTSGTYWTDTYSDVSINPAARFLALSEPVIGSLGMGQSNIHPYTVCGLSEKNNSRAIVQVGYRRAF